MLLEEKDPHSELELFKNCSLNMNKELAINLSRKDFHYISTSLLPQNDKPFQHLKDTYKFDENQFSDKKFQENLLNRERILDKYEISSQTLKKHSEKSFIEAIEYIVDDFVPNLTDSLTQNHDVSNKKPF